MSGGLLRSLGLIVAGLVVAACKTDGQPTTSVIALDTDVIIHERPLTLHLSLTPQHVADPLIVYATGDGGWWGGDKDVFDALVAMGYPVAGFSARDYVNHLGEGVTAISPAQMATDFAALIRVSKAALNLPASTSVVLVGFSRGAGLAVAVASQDPIKARLRGVIAIALTREEEYAAVPDDNGGPPAMLLTYPSLPLIGDIPVAVIQSTHDDYVPAAEARALFGPDTSSRLLRPIDSKDHAFEGAIPALDLEMTNCFRWIVRQ